ncbi:vomeronasal type-1 receptor 4-like [Bos indicus]|uniref:Vomeronasal type-1 receptor n=1 Tax=Bos indicus TaxID=9915 RepID=A0ABM4QST2_BOSIN
MSSPHSLSSAPGHSDSHSTSFEKNVCVTASQTSLKTMYLLQMGVGSLANVLLFFYHISPILFGHKKRPTDTILTHIAVANLLVLLSSGIPHTMAAFTSRKPLSPLGCKCVYYLQKVAHSTSLCSTCVLSTYQSFILTPGREGRSLLRGRAPSLTGSFCCTCWIFSVLMYIYVPMKTTASPNRHNYTDMQGDWFCSSSSPSAEIVVLWSTSDAVFIGLMIWSCGSMVLLLHRHRQRVQYIHTPTGHHRRPPETRAAHTTLMLVVTFVTFYVATSILAFYITAFFDFRQWLIQTSDVLLSCFPTVSPFLLLLRDPRTARICS